MVTSHGKLRHLLLNQEIVQVSLLGELITESDTLVVDTETDHHLTVLTDQGQSSGLSVTTIFRTFDGLVQGHSEFVVVVTDVFGLTPNGLPGLVEGRGLFLHNLELVHQVGLFLSLRCMLVLGKDQSEM